MALRQTGTVFPEEISRLKADEWLTQPEIASCRAYASASLQEDKIAARIALKRLLWNDFQIDPLAYRVASAGAVPLLHGWPGPSGLIVTLSHSAGLGAASWGWEREEETVGLDAQWIRDHHPGLRARLLTPQEQADGGHVLLLWALKEAAIKTRRQAWGRPMREIEVCLHSPSASEGTATIMLPSEPALTAQYARQGNWWLARASRPLVHSI